MQTLTSTGSVMRGNRLNVLPVGEGPAPSGPHSSPGCPRRGNIHCNIFFFTLTVMRFLLVLIHFFLKE